VINYYKENIQIYLLFTFWVLIGVFGGSLIFGILPITLFLMKQKNMYEEILIGYLFILILSDNADESLFFAKNLKNEYIALITIFFFFDRKSFYPINNLYKIYVPFFLFSVITMLFALGDTYFFTSIQKTLSYFLMFLILPTFIMKLFRENGLLFFRRFIQFLFTVLLIGLVLKYISYDLTHTSARFKGVFGGPNGLGVFALLFFIAFSFINEFYSEIFSKQEKLIIFSIIILSIYMTGSRNSVLAVLIFYFFQRYFGSFPYLGILVFLLLLIVFELVSANIVSIVDFLGIGGYFRLQTLEEGSGRYVAWGFAWKQIQHNFFIGRGFAYNEFYMRQHYRLLSKLGHQGGIHNSFLTFWMDQGLVGLIIYLRSYFLMFIRASKLSKFAFPAMLAVSFTAFFESWLVGSLSAFAFMGIFIFTLLTSEEIISEEKNKETNVL